MNSNMKVRILDRLSYSRFFFFKNVSVHAYNQIFVLLCVTNEFDCFIAYHYGVALLYNNQKVIFKIARNF